MPRLRLRAFALLLASLAVAPTFVGAQQAAEARTHTVKKGDTLWDLAKQYLGDAYLWPEIYRLNTGTIEDPHWIYPGEVLRLPGKGEATVAAQPGAPAPAAHRPSGMTIFNPDAVKRVKQSREALILRARATAVRSGQFAASPFMWEVGGPRDGGMVATTAEAAGIELTPAQRPLQYRETVFIRLPRGSAGTPGQKYLIYRLGEVIDGQGQVVIPTGIARVTSARSGGDVQAELMQKFEDVFEGQKVTELDTLQMPPNVFPARMEFGLATQVSWLYSNPVLPTTGQYLILAAGGKEGLMPGDQVSLRRDRGTDDTGARREEQEVAVAQVTRVTPWGASAIVIAQKDVGIARGMAARITAKMP
jgi:LysM repeat protein